ncbi:MAG TPA: hypothetical protein VFH68_18460 [Polyangia bacterium]|nr:hypothetical protein [Polyangia bacterium]
MPYRYRFRIAGLLPAFLLSGFGHLLVPAMVAGGIAQAAPAKPRVAVMSVTAEQLSAEVRAKMEAAVAGGLAASGADVVDSATTMRRITAKGLRGCDTSTCRMAIAEVTGTSYLVRGSVESMGRSYTVRLEMIDGVTGGVLGTREDRCEICTESEAYETASVTASALKAEVLKRPGPATAADESALGPGTLAPSAGRPTGDDNNLLTSGPPPAASVEARRGRLGALSWIGVGAGAAAIGAGIVLIAIDGHGTCSQWRDDRNCLNHFTTRNGGVALIGAGALSAALGATFLIGRF